MAVVVFFFSSSGMFRESLMPCFSHPFLLNTSTLFQILTCGVAIEDKSVSKKKYCLVKIAAL